MLYRSFEHVNICVISAIFHDFQENTYPACFVLQQFTARLCTFSSFFLFFVLFLSLTHRQQFVHMLLLLSKDIFVIVFFHNTAFTVMQLCFHYNYIVLVTTYV